MSTNAHLIAAAPELLELAKSVTREIPKIDPCEPLASGGHDRLNIIYRAAEIVIAKAEGKQ